MHATETGEGREGEGKEERREIERERERSGRMIILPWDAQNGPAGQSDSDLSAHLFCLAYDWSEDAR